MKHKYNSLLNIIAIIALINTVTLSSCNHSRRYLNKDFSEKIKDSISCEYAFSDNAVFYFEKGLSSAWICTIDNDGRKRTLITEKQTNGNIGKGILFHHDLLYFIVRKDEQTVFCSYNMNSNQTVELGKVDKWVLKWGLCNSKFYFTVENQEHFNTNSLFEYDPIINEYYVISPSTYDFTIDDEALMWIEKDGTDYTVFKRSTNNNLDKLCFLTYGDPDMDPLVRLNDKAILISYPGCIGKLLLFDSNICYDYPDNIYDAMLTNDSTYYITYHSVGEDCIYDELDNLYVRDYTENTPKTILTTLESPSFIGITSNNKVLLKNEYYGAVRSYTKLYAITKSIAEEIMAY